ncbi:MerR family transcriptional regulator [Sphingobacteriaceae bacterium]|nr:MerR family transcriptional regulator [Sphingobacteriaceae bacterium]
MSVNEKEETEKLYYSISEVSDLFDLNASTLRFWEKEFDVLKPTKNKKGNRLFTKKDIEHIASIVELVKQKGYTIQGAKEQLKNKSVVKSAGSHADVIEKLKNIKAKLIELRDNQD